MSDPPRDLAPRAARAPLRRRAPLRGRQPGRAQRPGEGRARLSRERHRRRVPRRGRRRSSTWRTKRTVIDAPQGRLFRSFKVGRAFVTADGIVQVGVLKTHQLMRLTGGVKLTFGCIPGLTKAQLHVRAERREDFADMLLDLHLAVAPRFTIIDGIIAMDGQGPGSGRPRAARLALRGPRLRRARRRARRSHRSRARLSPGAGRGRASRVGRPGATVSARGRSHRAGAFLQAGGTGRAGAGAGAAAARRPEPPHGASQAGRRAGMHVVRRVRRHLRSRRDHSARRRRSSTTVAACAATPAPRSARRAPSTASCPGWAACWAARGAVLPARTSDGRRGATWRGAGPCPWPWRRSRRGRRRSRETRPSRCGRSSAAAAHSRRTPVA